MRRFLAAFECEYLFYLIGSENDVLFYIENVISYNL